jgi:signal transduction histidine kinase
MNKRVTGLVLLVLASATATVAVALAGWGLPVTSISSEGRESTRVLWVLPGGPSWADGMRPGQTVVELTATVAPTEWRMVTSDGTSLFVTSQAEEEATLRGRIPLALMGLIAALLAWVMLRRLNLAVALALLSLPLSTFAFAASGFAVADAVVALLALLAPAVWLVAIVHTRRGQIAVLATAAAVAAVWIAARGWIWPVYDVAEMGRQGAVFAGLVAVVASDWEHWRERVLALDSVRLADVVAVVAVASAAALVALVIQAPLLVVIGVVAVALLAYSRFRRGLAAAFDQILLGDVRSRASLEAIEEERSRIARDLHDEPLQEIAAAIHALDRHDGTEKETALLRQAASHLRRVTTELRPPVLDDIGLGATLEFVAQSAGETAPTLVFDVSVMPSDQVGERPPADVELAVFRIVQEAIDNAVRHAEARRISLEAEVTPRLVTATVTDDGRGMDDGAARKAAMAGHVGLVSMAQRAAAIGADFEIASVRPSGTTIRVRWDARS